MKLSALSALAADFPTVEVEYEDLLQYRYVPDARGANNTIDCLGLALEVYRRAGIGLPDINQGNAVLIWNEIFEVVPTADTLYDLIYMNHGMEHIFTVVRPGVALSIRPVAGVITRKVVAIEALEGVVSYRVRPECLP